jgi:hypothetical protein
VILDFFETINKLLQKQYTFSVNKKELKLLLPHDVLLTLLPIVTG